MTFGFLPESVKNALDNLNCNFLTEIRLRADQPIIIEYRGRQCYLGEFGATERKSAALICGELNPVLSAAMENSVYAFTEQLKNAFVTIGGGIRIGIAGEYITDGGMIKTVHNPTSLNIRIPHDAVGCAAQLYRYLNEIKPQSTLIFSPPGYGKTTILRDYARHLGQHLGDNVLVYDERYELSAIDGSGRKFNLGMNCDVVRGGDKLSGFANAIRVMKPNVLICDELYGEKDFAAIRFALDCGINVIASTHFSDKGKLCGMNFECYVELTGVGKQAVIYDKNFNIIGNCDTFCTVRGDSDC